MFYRGCGDTKNCFGDTDGCVDRKNCRAVVSILVEGERYIFELQAANSKYVAVGLSEDTKMASDKKFFSSRLLNRWNLTFVGFVFRAMTALLNAKMTTVKFHYTCLGTRAKRIIEWPGWVFCINENIMFISLSNAFGYQKF